MAVPESGREFGFETERNGNFWPNYVERQRLASALVNEPDGHVSGHSVSDRATIAGNAKSDP